MFDRVGPSSPPPSRRASPNSVRAPGGHGDRISRARNSAKRDTLSSDPGYTETDARKSEPSLKPLVSSPALRLPALQDFRDALNAAMRIANPFMVYASKKDVCKLARPCADLCAAMAAASKAAKQGGLGHSCEGLVRQLGTAPRELRAAVSSKDINRYMNVMLELSNALPPEPPEPPERPEPLQPRKVVFSPVVEVAVAPDATFLVVVKLTKAVVLAQQDVRRFQSAGLRGDEKWAADPRQKRPVTLHDSSLKLAIKLVAAKKALAASHLELAKRLACACNKQNDSSLRVLGAKGRLTDYAAALDELAADIEKAVHKATS